MRPGSSRRAFDVWVHLARKEGWEVEEVSPSPSDGDDSVCGEVRIEGITYTIRYALRVRGRGLDDRTVPPSWRPVLNFAAWAEPRLDTYRLE